MYHLILKTEHQNVEVVHLAEQFVTGVFPLLRYILTKNLNTKQ